MSSAVVALLLAIGGSALAWSRTMKSTNRRDTAYIVAIVAAIIIFFIIWTFFKYILNFDK